VKYNRNARLNTRTISDRRGGGRRSGGFGGRSGMGGMGPGRGGGFGRRSGGVAAGGGVGGIVLLLVILFLSGTGPSGLVDPGTGPGGGGPAGGGQLEQCRTGADIEERQECRFVAVQNSVQDFWDDEFGRRGATYQPATFNVFEGSVSTACGQASSQVGPFYCPGDQGVYLDLGFFVDLQTRFGARGGDFAEAYVVAHEYGHHVQHLTGQMERVRTREGADSDAVRLELQADCYAGMWAHHATTATDERGEAFITEITDDDIADGIDAAERIGDDYIQERFRGSVTPETWTHGSSEQRRRWFQVGMREGALEACDTFSASQL
jgi:uncharacterized protein